MTLAAPTRAATSEPDAGPRLCDRSPTPLDALLDQFTRRWVEGERPRAEDFLTLLSPADPSGSVELIYHEYCLAEESGLVPDPAAYYQRFPEQGERLARLLELHGAMASELESGEHAAMVAALPRIGDEIGPYLLIRELGRGTFARVFLAEQLDLEGRPVVVKVSDRPSAEARMLARAPHPHIVSILREATTEEGLHLICMPFLGGATLEAILVERRARGERPTSGAAFLEELDRVSAPEFPAGLVERPARELIGGMSYARTVAWVLARLAEALDHAYEKEITHGDLKPSNVLIAADGQPMLLDFNLSSDRRAEDAGDAGGTLGYMAPERLQAVAARSGRGESAPVIDRHRADVYALGLILEEALTGRAPRMPATRGETGELAAMLAEARGRERSDWPSGVPAGLRPVLARCLEPSPARRYRRARELAADLDRWRADLSLRHARAAWWSAPAGWARRRRIALAAGAACVAVGLGATGLVQRNLDERGREFSSRVALTWDPFNPARTPSIAPGQYETLASTPAEAHRALAAIGAFGPGGWRAQAGAGSLSPGERADLEAWVVEQAFRYGLPLIRPAYDAMPEDRAEARAELEQIWETTPVEPLEALCRALGSGPLSSPNESPSWLADYAAGVRAETVGRGDLGRLNLKVEDATIGAALAWYSKAVAARPDSFWAHYQSATAAFRLGKHERARSGLQAAVALRPGNVAAWQGLASCYHYLGQHREAEDACRRAIALDPTSETARRIEYFVASDPARRESARARYLIGRSRDTAAKLWLTGGSAVGFASVGFDPMVVHAATTSFDDPADVNLRFWRASQLMDDRDYEGAFEEWSSLLELSPDHLRARFNRAVAAQWTDRTEIAMEDYDRLLEEPHFDTLLSESREALALYSVVSAGRLRAGDVELGVELAEQGLARTLELGRGPAEAFYALARAFAVAARRDASHLATAANYLREAARIDTRFLTDRAASDPLLDPVRGDLTPLALEAHGH